MLIVITDASTGRDKQAIEKAAKDLIEGSIAVIPVAIGNKPVPDFEKEFPDEDVIRANDTDHPIKTADKIQDKLEDGNLFSLTVNCMQTTLRLKFLLCCFI